MTTLKRAAFALALTGSLSSLPAAEPYTAERLSTICRSVDSLMHSRYDSREPAPGAAVIVQQGDRMLFEGYYGLARVDSGQPIDQNTRFCIASLSKQFTVVALLQLVERGLVDLDAPLSRYFDFGRPWAERVTLRHLASHTSGIPDSRDRTDRQACIYATDSTSMAYFPMVEQLKFEPGAAYDYLNPSFLLLADVVRQVSGQDFLEYVAEHLFEPAGMTHACYFDPAMEAAYESHGYIPGGTDGERTVWRQYDYGEETFYATRPDGGIYATARDMAAWELALAEGLLLRPETLRLAYTPVISVSDSPWCDYQRRPDTAYALGWFVDTTPGRPVKVYHTGDNGGYQAYVAKYPSLDLSIIVLENRNDRDRWSMALALDSILLDEPTTPASR